MTDPRADRDPLADLERLAKAATPGPWISEDDERGDVRVGTADGKAWVAFTGGRDDEEAIPDADYIAAADPATVLALIDRLRGAELALRITNEVHPTTKPGTAS